jgi:hypothetical protein
MGDETMEPLHAVEWSVDPLTLQQIKDAHEREPWNTDIHFSLLAIENAALWAFVRVNDDWESNDCYEDWSRRYEEAREALRQYEEEKG